MVRLKGFDNYYLCLKSGEVFSKRKDGSFRPLKREYKGGTVYYRLSLNGFEERVPVFRILNENLKEIERYFSQVRPGSTAKKEALER